MRTVEQTVNEILDLAAKHFKVPREQFSPDDDMVEKLKTLRQGQIDSLEILELVTRLEYHFQVELPDYEVQAAKSFRALASCIQSRL